MSPRVGTDYDWIRIELWIIDEVYYPVERETTSHRGNVVLVKTRTDIVRGTRFPRLRSYNFLAAGLRR